MNFQTRMKHFFTIFSTGSRFTSNLILLDFNLKKLCKYPRLFKTLCYSKLFDFKIYFISSYNFACSWGYFNFETEGSYLLAMNLIYAGYIWMKRSCAGELLELILHSKQDHYWPTAALTAPFHSSAKDAALKKTLEWRRKIETGVREKGHAESRCSRKTMILNWGLRWWLFQGVQMQAPRSFTAIWWGCKKALRTR